MTALCHEPRSAACVRSTERIRHNAVASRRTRCIGQCCSSVGLPSLTWSQHCAGVGSTYRVCLNAPEKLHTLELDTLVLKMMPQSINIILSRIYINNMF